MVELSGETGLLKVGYKTVADLRKWKLIRSDATTGSVTSTLRAFTTKVDSFWVTQTASFSLELNMGGAAWVWRTIKEVTFKDGLLFVIVEGDPVAIAEERAHGTQQIRGSNQHQDSNLRR